MNNLPAVQNYSMTDLEKMATTMVKSRLFGIENIDQAVTLMLVAQSEGLHPAMAARDYHIIQGRPSMKADTMLARFQQAGGRVEWTDYTEEKVAGKFSHPQSPLPVLISWTMEMAKRIGLAGKDNWKKYPRAMLRARCVSEGVRATYPAIAAGIYTPEEVQDFQPASGTLGGALTATTLKQSAVVAETASEVRRLADEDKLWDAYQLMESITDPDERLALVAMLPSRIKSVLNTMADAERASEVGIISQAQHRRLEARIKELKLDRDDMKAYCKDNFGKDHFPDLTQEEYQDLDRFIDAQAAPLVDWPAKIAAAPTLDDLIAVWGSIPKAEKPAHEAAKDARKAELTPATADFVKDYDEGAKA